MPEEVIRYRVEIDESDLASQIERVRNQLDNALGAASFQGPTFSSSTNVVAPDLNAYNIPQSTFAQNPGNFSNDTDASFWNKASATFGNLSSNVTGGFLKAKEDITSFANRIGGSAAVSEAASDGMLPSSYFGYLSGTLGFGSNLASPISQGAYQTYSLNKFAEDTGDYVSENAFSLPGLGLMAGSLALAPFTGGASLAGLLPGLGLWSNGGLVDVANNLITADYKQRKDLSQGIGEIATQTFGGISRSKATGIAQSVIDFADSEEGWAKGYTVEELTGDITSFANAGGFSQVRSGEELDSKISSIMENTRRVARSLGVFHEQAAQVMADLEQRQITSTSNMGNFSSDASTIGSYLGGTGLDAINIGVQTAESFRGSGIYQQTAFNVGIDAALESEKMARSTDPYIRNMMFQVGGQAGYQNMLTSTYANYGKGGMTEVVMGGGMNNNGSNPGGSAPQDMINYFNGDIHKVFD